MNATGTKTDSSTSVIADDWREDLSHRHFGGFGGRQFGVVFHHLFDRLNHDDRIIHHDTDGQHDREQRDSVRRIANRVQHDERADQADRDRDCRDQCGTQISQEQVDDENDQDERFDQRLLNFMDRSRDKCRRIVGDLPRQIVGKSRAASAIACLTPPSAVSALAPAPDRPQLAQPASHSIWWNDRD